MKQTVYFFGSFSQNGAGITHGYVGFSCNILIWWSKGNQRAATGTNANGV